MNYQPAVIVFALLCWGMSIAASALSVEIIHRDGFEDLALRPVAATYLGLNAATIREIGFDAVGNAVLVGHFSAHTANDLDDATVIGTPGDASLFVAKMDPNGQFLWRTVIGGSGKDRGYGLSVAPNGDLVLAGRTSSTDFPTTPGAFDRIHHGGIDNPVHGSTDGYVLRLAADGQGLVWSTLFGGSGQEGNRGGLALAPDGAVYACGSVESNSPDFLLNPSSGGNPGFINARPGGFSDGYVIKFLPDGSGIQWTRFLGSGTDTAGEELPVGCRVLADGRLHTVGNLWGAGAPTTDGSIFQGGNADLYMAVLSADGMTLHRAGYIGGSGDEFLEHRQVVGDANSIFTAGFTTSPDFPTVNAERPSQGSGRAEYGVVMRLQSDLSPAFSTYVSGDGPGPETAFVEGPDNNGAIYVTGRTGSDDIGAGADAFQSVHLGGTDAFVQVYTADGNLLHATFLGGSDDDYGRYIAHDPATGITIVALETFSADLPASATAPNPTLHPAGEDAFIVMFRPES